MYYFTYNISYLKREKKREEVLCSSYAHVYTEITFLSNCALLVIFNDLSESYIILYTVSSFRPIAKNRKRVWYNWFILIIHFIEMARYCKIWSDNRLGCMDYSGVRDRGRERKREREKRDHLCRDL